MIRIGATLAAAVIAATPASAQDASMAGMNMPGMTMPMPSNKPAKAAPKRTPPAKTTPPAKDAAMGDMPGMDHSAMPGMDMSTNAKPAAQAPQPGMDSMPGMTMPANGQGTNAMPGMKMSGDGQGMGDMPGMPMAGVQPTGTALPAGNAAAPDVPLTHAADQAYPPEAMAMARHHLQNHHGGQNFYQVLLNLAEYQFRNGGDGYRWDGQAWFGGDTNRLFVKSEGEGATRRGVDAAEVQALYSRAIGPYFNLQAGVRHDFQPSPTRTYATAGIEGLAAGYFEVEAAAFVSNKGDVLGRLEGYYDQRITQRLILQPRVELNLAAQNVPENRIGSGLSNAELGLRLRYEIKREFAPYIGFSWDRRLGDTARYVRAAGEAASTRSIVAGVRMWF